MEVLDEQDRTAILLRHFDNKSLHEVGQALGISEDAAQKRVSRAVDQLRESFSKRGVAVGSAGLIALLTAHAVQAAPAGLGAVVAAAAALSGTAVHSAATIGATQALLMTTTQKILIAATAASIAVAGGTAVYETHHVSQMQEEIQALQQQQEPLRTQVQQLREERDNATRQLTSLRQEDQQLRLDSAGLAGVRDKTARAQASAAPAASATAPNSFAGLAKMFKDPQMKDMIHAQQKMMVDQMYGDLFKTLALSSTDEDALKKLLLDRQVALTDAGLAAMGGSGSDTNQAAEDPKALKAQYDKQIQDFLGPQGYELFQQYDQTVAERVQVNLFKQSLSADTALTDQQENDLIAAMYENRKALPASSQLNSQTRDPSQLTEDSIAQALKVQEQLQQKNAESATAILTPAQLEQFTKFQQQMSAMSAASMKMATQMFGQKNSSAGQAPNSSSSPPN
jgi:hypothetical protein